jgi:ABC-type amino acid transport substrate-binding protein
MRRSKIAFLAAAFGLLAPLFSSAPGQAQSTLQTVKSRGALIAGVRFDTAPYGFLDASGKNLGIDVEIAEEIAKRLSVRLELIQVTGQSRIPTLNSGKIDLLLAALTHTRAREKAVDFSITYVQDGLGIMVKKGGSIRTLGDLNGKSVATVQGTTITAPLKKVAPQARVVEYPEYPQAFLAFQQGLADSFCADLTVLDKFLKSDPNAELLTAPLAPEPIAIGMRKTDPEWRNTLNGLLQDMVVDGTWETIIKKYVSIPLPTPEVWPN